MALATVALPGATAAMSIRAAALTSSDPRTLAVVSGARGALAGARSSTRSGGAAAGRAGSGAATGAGTNTGADLGATLIGDVPGVGATAKEPGALMGADAG